MSEHHSKSESCTVILPLPSPYLHPNRQPGTRGGRMRKHRLTKAYRSLASEAMDAVQVESKPWTKAIITLVYFFKTKRNRDDDNLAGWMKAGRDGLADAGIVNDDADFTYDPAPRWEVDKTCPRVEITITDQHPHPRKRATV